MRTATTFRRHVPKLRAHLVRAVRAWRAMARSADDHQRSVGRAALLGYQIARRHCRWCHDQLDAEAK